MWNLVMVPGKKRRVEIIGAYVLCAVFLPDYLDDHRLGFLLR
jgi:hypothetical protein